MRIDVNKTYKLFVGGAFPRSESGHSYRPAGAPHVNVARASRKDLRDAVVAARAALPGWQRRSGYNRGQILYRLAEILETRKASIAAEIAAGAEAVAEVEDGVDLLTWYAGLCDKLPSLLGSQNAVSGPFFNFSTVEPTGVIAAVAPARPCLLGLLAVVVPLLTGGNTVVALVSEPSPLAGLALGELCAVSDVPAGAVNLLAGPRAELVPQLASHRDIDGILAGEPLPRDCVAAAADGVKRVRQVTGADVDWSAARSLPWVEPFVEVKTLWHPVAP